MTSQPVVPGAISPELASLLAKMFTKNPNARIELEDVGRHPWLAGLSPGARYVFFQRRRSWNKIATTEAGGRDPAAPVSPCARPRQFERVRLMPKRSFTPLRIASPKIHA